VSDRLGAALAPLLAVTSGLALLVSHPPIGWWWASFLAPGLLLAALDADRSAAGSERSVRAARLGALTGVTAYAPMLVWLILPAGYVGWSLLVAVQAAWLAVLAALIRPLLAHRLLPLAMALVWTGIDAWRAVWPMNGFEWGAIHYAHVDGSWLLPVARLVGGRGITFLVVLISSAAFVVIRQMVAETRARGVAGMEATFGSLQGPIAMLVGALLVSVLATIEPPAETGETLDVLVVQGNDIRHWEEPRPADTPLAIATTLRDLTVEAVAADGPPDLTVWPESSIDRDPTTPRGEPLRQLADEAAQRAGALVSGASLDGPDPATQREIAALLLVDGFDERDRYVKRRLVPFGEFVPARELLGWFPPLEQIPRDAVPGPGPQSLQLPDGVTAAVIICFETLFADVVRTNVLAEEAPADLILSLTNDASFGDSAEPAQHLAQSRLRAVETGRWVVHAALSGSSAFIDPDGVTYDDTPLFTATTLRREVPLVHGLTPFLVIGDVLSWVARALTVALAIGLLVAWSRRRRSSRATPADEDRGHAAAR
jgi:apolipoprotein N-acyltransferase